MKNIALTFTEPHLIEEVANGLRSKGITDAFMNFRTSGDDCIMIYNSNRFHYVDATFIEPHDEVLLLSETDLLTLFLLH